ncbi:hypothetical protein K7X08_016808 [Anisodus acutangulus]|uniref:Uncharacterized protein n=1 Tax=Anisodus acutangulus TaxID=402998 RepID=A0A9Q1R6K7_9SOLA|nr:hypothetical protein K7X08_016808 [Anisodus acutangulus]
MHGEKDGINVTATVNPNSTVIPNPSVLHNQFASLGEGSGSQEYRVEDGVDDVPKDPKAVTDAVKGDATVGDVQQVNDDASGQLIEIAIPIVKKPLNPNAKVYTSGKKTKSPTSTKQWADKAFSKNAEMLVTTDQSCKEVQDMFAKAADAADDVEVISNAIVESADGGTNAIQANIGVDHVDPVIKVPDADAKVQDQIKDSTSLYACSEEVNKGPGVGLPLANVTEEFLTPKSKSRSSVRKQCKVSNQDNSSGKGNAESQNNQHLKNKSTAVMSMHQG